MRTMDLFFEWVFENMQGYMIDTENIIRLEERLKEIHFENI